ncbi:MAG: hypothetical protein ACYCUY_00705 [Acidithiobacillus sp.]
MCNGLEEQKEPENYGTTKYAKKQPRAGYSSIFPLEEWAYNIFKKGESIYFGAFSSCIGLVALHNRKAVAIHMALYTVKDEFVETPMVAKDIINILNSYDIKSPKKLEHVLLFGFIDCWNDGEGMTILEPIRSLFTDKLKVKQLKSDGDYTVSTKNNQLEVIGPGYRKSRRRNTL